MKMLKTLSDRISVFLRRQFIQICDGGWPVLVQKLRTLILILPALVAALIIHVLQPIILIRLGGLLIERIGHFSVDTEMYFCERDMGMHPAKSIDIFYYRTAHAYNQQLLKMWYRVLPRYPRVKFMSNYFIEQVDRLSRLLPGAAAHALPEPTYFDIHHLFKRMSAHLSFTHKEEQLGRKFLQDLGIPEDKEFVCFHNRESFYLEALYNSQAEGFKRHDYRDSDIRNYVPAMEELTRRGYYVFKMGAVVKEPLSTDNPMIIDYATKYRSDFLDIYLGARCKFFLGTSSGLYGIPFVFRKPIAYANFSLLEPKFVGGEKDIFIPKKFWLRKEKRFLTFKELYDTGIGLIVDAGEYASLGVEVIENTPEEITALAVEMDQRLKGVWWATPETEVLLQRYRTSLKDRALDGLMANIGTEFLRQNNKELL